MSNKSKYLNSTFLLSLVSLISVVFFLLWLLYLVIKSPKETSTPIYSFCPNGQCATSLFTGFKRCTTDDKQVEYDPSSEVCNSKELCDNIFTPYALLPDGSTNFNGVCTPNVSSSLTGISGLTCPCVKNARCPNYITSLFSVDGNPLQSFDNQNIFFPQKSTNDIGTPLMFTSIGTNFCTVPASWLPLSVCTFIENNNPTSDQIVTCLQNGCNQGSITILPGVCKNGTLAVITSDSSNLNKDNIQEMQFGCVATIKCSCNQIPIYDTNFGATICKSIQ